MAGFKRIAITRPDPAVWLFVVEIEDAAGGRLSFEADAEQLDIIAAALDEKLDALVDAAARQSLGA